MPYSDPVNDEIETTLVRAIKCLRWFGRRAREGAGPVCKEGC